jgi:hypothetical protein
MYEYSLNNHYKWGWGTDKDIWFNEPDYTQPFKITFATCKRQPKSFREECVFAATHLANQTNKHVYVGLSGGSDSQIVCLALREAKVPFTPCIIEMQGGLNLHDTKNAFEFCKKFNLTPIKYKINLLDFYATQGRDWMLKYKISNKRTVLQLWLQKFCSDGTFIMAGGDVQLNRYLTDVFDKTKQSELGWRHTPTPILQHLVSNNLEGTTKFFMYTPELIASIINSSIMRQFAEIQDSVYSQTYIARKNFWQIYNNIPKQMLYKDNWPEMNIVPKYHGFENAELSRAVNEVTAQISSEILHSNSDKVIHINYSELSDYLTFEKNKEQKIWYSNVQNRTINGEELW